MLASTTTRVKRLTSFSELRAWRSSLKDGDSVGFVPTMGALHAGHSTLFEKARRENEQLLASIFVNPLQFNEGKDFERYPKTLEEDCQILEAQGVNAVYLPNREDLYPEGYDTTVTAGRAGDVFEGHSRPGHFEGMLSVVLKLFLRTKPHRAYFGEKDAQQLFLVKKMTKDLDLPLTIVPCETVRCEDGLALSTRNSFLGKEERERSLCIIRALRAADALYASGVRVPAELESVMRQCLQEEAGFFVEYAAVVDDKDFQSAQENHLGSWRAILAVRVGATRLIDNLLLSESA